MQLNGKRARTDDEAKILIVDDDEKACKTLTRILGKMGYEVNYVGTGKAALKKVQETIYNIILLDIKLPDYEGIELISLMKKNRPTTIIMMVTAFASLETAIEAMNRGASAYITKPFNMEEVLQKIKDAVEKQHLEIDRNRLYKQLQIELKERKKIEKALRSNEERLRNITETSPDYIMMLDSECKIQFTNRVEQGVTLEDLIDTPLYNLVEEEERPRIEKVLKDVIKQNKSTFYETTYKRPDGTIIHYESHAAPMESNKTVIGIIVNSRDVTERKIAEKALQDSEERYALAQRAANLGSWDWNIHCGDLKWSEQVEPMFGYKKGEFVGTYEGFLESVHPDDRQFVIDSTNSSVNEGGEYKIEHRIVLPDGLIRWVSEKGDVLRDETGKAFRMIGVVQDITERKIAEIALKESERKFKHLAEKSPNMIFINKRGRVVYANEKCEEIMGYSRDEFYSSNFDFLTLIAPEYRELIVNSFQKHFQDKESGPIEYVLIAKDGKRIPAIFTSKLIDFEGDRAILGIITDITEQKKTEKALAHARDTLAQEVELATRDLRKEKKRIETVVETIPDGIVVIDSDGKINLVNKVFKDYYSKIYEANFPNSLQELSLLKNPFGDTVSKLFYSKAEESITIEPIKGLHLQLASSRLIIPPSTHLGAIIAIRDVTPFVELDNLRKQFVSVVSHELRTPITAINLSLRNLQKFRKKISEEQLDEIINMTADSALVLTQMIEDLLVVSQVEVGKIKLEWKPYQLSNVVQGVLNVLEPRRVEKSIALQVDINPEIMLYGDDKRVSQIFRILVDNAIKYSKKNSTVIIKALNEYYGEFNPDTQDGTLIQVIDSGRGIPKEDIPYIFDRFFRSKDVSDKRGSGLGLSIAQEMIGLHQGEIYVDSKYGEGSTFSVFLPRIKNLVDEDSYATIKI